MPPRSRLRIEFPSLVESVRERLERERLELERLRPLLPPPWSEVLRPEDLLHFRVELKDLVPGADGRWHPKASTGLLVFHLQPQHMLEHAPLEIGGWTTS